MIFSLLAEVSADSILVRDARSCSVHGGNLRAQSQVKDVSLTQLQGSPAQLHDILEKASQ